MLSRLPKPVRTASAPILAALTTIAIMAIGAHGGFASLLFQLVLLPMLVVTIIHGFVPMMVGIVAVGLGVAGLAGWFVGAGVASLMAIACGTTWWASWRKPDPEHMRDACMRGWIPCYDSGRIVPAVAMVLGIVVGIIGMMDIISGAAPGQMVLMKISMVLESVPEMQSLFRDPALQQGVMGLAAFSLVLVIVVNAVMADWISAVLCRSGQRRIRLMRHIDLPIWYPFVMAGLLILAVVPSGMFGLMLDKIRMLAANMLLVMLLPGVLMGLSVIHVFSERIKGGRIVALLFFYAVWSVFFIPVGIMIVTIGILANPLRIGRASSAQSLNKTTG